MLTNKYSPSPFLPITSLQPQSLHAVTHSFAQRRAAIYFSINMFRTLSIATGVVHHPSSGRALLASQLNRRITAYPDAKEIDAPVLAPALARGLARRLARRQTQIRTPSSPASPFNAVFRHSMHGNTIQRKVWSHTANSGKLFFATEGLRGQSKLGA